MNIQNDTKVMLKEAGWTHRHFAKELGVNENALCRYLNRKKPSRSITEKIIPYVYGELRPSSVSTSTPPPE